MLLRSRHSGFTLLELVLVLLVICIVMGTAAPSLRGWGRGTALRDSADQFVAVTRLARTQAISTCQVFRLQVNSAQRRYWLSTQIGEQTEPFKSTLGTYFVLPDDYGIRLVNTVQSQESYIEFQPTGRVQPARVRITSDRAEDIDIECTAPAESFEVVEAEGRMR